MVINHVTIKRDAVIYFEKHVSVSHSVPLSCQMSFPVVFLVNSGFHSIMIHVETPLWSDTRSCIATTDYFQLHPSASVLNLHFLNLKLQRAELKY